MIAVTFVNSVAAISQTFCLTLWRASWQGGLATLAVWTICRLFPRLPAAVRCWLWRLALIKFVLTLLLPLAAIPFPVLRAAQAPNSMAATSRQVSSAPQEQTDAAAIVAAPPATSASALAPNAASANGSAATMPRIERGTAIDPSPQRGVAGNAAIVNLTADPVSALVAGSSQGGEPSGDLVQQGLPALFTIVFAIYIAGIAVSISRLTRSAVMTRRFLSVPRRPIEDPEVLSAAADLCGQLGITRIPRIFDAPDVTASQLVAAFPPVILLPVLPEQLQAGLDQRAARRLMLAHELAHFRRSDLWWGGFSALAYAVFLFHPLLWLARREEEMSREMACDALVLATTHASASTYGAVLVEAAASWRPALPGHVSVVSLGIAKEIGPIRQRLLALRNSGPHFSARRLRALTATVSIAAVLAFLPWRVVVAGGRVADRPRTALLPKVVGSVVEGQVLLLPDHETGANCSVTLEPIGNGETTREPIVAQTDVEGKYHFDAVPEGTYLLSTCSWNIVETRALANVPGKSSRRITVRTNRSLIAQNLLLTKVNVTVTGRVSDTRTGQSVAEAQVGVGSVEGGPDSVNLWESVRGDGEYHLWEPVRGDRRYRFAVAPGRVAMYVRYHRFVPPTASRVNFGDEPIDPYRLVASDTARLARIVTVSDDHALDMDLAVSAHYIPVANSLAPITGRVVGADGRPCARAEVYVFHIIRTSRQQQHPASPTIARTDASGQFRVDGIPMSWAGTQLDIRARGSFESEGVSAPCVLTLPKAGGSPAKLTPLVIRLATGPGAVVSGQVTGVDGRPAAWVPVDLSLMSEKREMLSVSCETVTDAAGRYRFARLWPDLNDGSISVTRGIGSGGSLFLFGKNRLLPDKLINKPVEAPRLVLQPTTSKLGGVVLTTAGKPAAKMLVFVSGHVKNPGGAAAVTDSAGRFRLDCLQADSYRVICNGPQAIGEIPAKAGNMNLRLVLKARPH